MIRLARFSATGKSLKSTIAAATSVIAGTARSSWLTATSPSRFVAAKDPCSVNWRNSTMLTANNITSR